MASETGDALPTVHRSAETQNYENNPMQSRIGHGSQHSSY